MIYVQRASCYAALGNLNAAVSDYTTALQLGSHSDTADVYFLRARCHDRLQNHAFAASDYSQAISNARNWSPYLMSNLFHGRGVAYYQLGRSDLAFADLNKALEIDPGNGRAQHDRGVFFLRAGKHREAKRDLKRAVQLGVELEPELRHYI